MQDLILIFIFVVTVGSACVVAFSRNLIYAAFALLGTFLGVAATFILLQADFLALVQVVVYAGGILVLILFAVMLTSKINLGQETNPIMNTKMAIPLLLLMAFVFITVLIKNVWDFGVSVDVSESSISEIGNALLSQYLLPFELISVVMLVVMIAAAIISRRHIKE